jgi:hypothetical protein
MTGLNSDRSVEAGGCVLAQGLVTSEIPVFAIGPAQQS